MQIGLLRLGYYLRAPNGQIDEAFLSSVSEFQGALGHEQSGHLTFDEYSTLTDGLSWLSPVFLGVAGGESFGAWGDEIWAEGTWQFTDGAGDEGIPLQTSEIRCSRSDNVCREAQAFLSEAGKNNFLLGIDVKTYEIKSWTDSEIVAREELLYL